MEGVEAGGELAFQGIVDGPVPGQAREAGKGRRADLDRIVCLATRSSARMPLVETRLVHYIKLRGVKGGNESGTDALAAACQFLRH